MGKRKERKWKPPAAGVQTDESKPHAAAPSEGGESPPKVQGTLVSCPGCGGSGERRKASAWAECQGCGTLFLRERPSAGHMAKAREMLFDRAFALPNHEERREARALAGEAMCGFFQIRIGKHAALNAFGKHVLEVNCGLGFRLRAFQNYGWTTVGTETSATAFEYARRMSLDVRHGWLDEASFGKTRFDLALFCSTFGEILDPGKAVVKLRELLGPDGLVCVLREPLAAKDMEPSGDATRLCLYSADSIKRVYCQNAFSFISEELHEDDTGTFWFRAKTGGNR